jgi:pimeloyl-ACP methyl ester carboxylesterase
MSTAHSLPHRIHTSRRRRLWLLAGLLAAAGIGSGVYVLFFSGPTSYAWPPEPCVVEGVEARCGTFAVPENRTKPSGRTIGLNVVVLPALFEATPTIAFAYLAGGPGDAATEAALTGDWQSSLLRANRDFVLVDQRGTGGSRPDGGDVTQYGTRMAMDDLDAVRAALGYRQLDVYGGSYGATAAQVYLKLHPASVHTLILSGATAVDIPFFERYATSAQRALHRLAELCASQAPCRKAFPDWERKFTSLVRRWNVEPADGMSGDELATIVQRMLLDVDTAVSVPWIVSRAAAGDYAPLEQAGSAEIDVDLDLMGSSIWCNEPWTGLDAEGPWGTSFDGHTTRRIAAFRQQCVSVPRRAESPSLWRLPSPSRVPLLALVGGADPQDPLENLSDVERHFPDSRTVVLPHLGHNVTWGRACDAMLAEFTERGTTKGLNTSACVHEVAVPTFELSD